MKKLLTIAIALVLVAAGRGKAHRQGEKHRGNKQ